ncbi:MAG TPA: undecaprenyldiphospho-muramoylpentapeptide beta-N-acetylglucosaminyltransferase [Bryobacteraceae bacterium]|nr:undecaprenyldiphospho-muramoylpentapeptide beta-N-acetylglucosaminyltransferase [Bryobacteraceae bacterium]HPQ17359.1 undecaprenyldiphospho-muramoylpentapeptide beta-N-acetylglucosaminyltransferase [Bryobacteraceae bacterium]HPU74026.1 undecaprenyldiphospho-muramoylpentapeptide beta-N-acetylglucosaminyltransferase [Bryobacteraceae bacterium]
MKFLMAGGGTGGHVIPALAVAEELKRRGHEPFFVGTAEGIEAKLVPAAGFRLERIRIGGLKRVGMARRVKTLWQLGTGTLAMMRSLARWRPAAVFSMGGYVAGPVVLAAWARRIPMVLMEPNAAPGMTNRWMGRVAARVLVNFEETARWFPEGKSELTGLPVREEFFSIPPKRRSAVLTVLITGGSRGSRTLNQAARGSWPLFREADFAVRLIHQTGREAWDELASEFARTGLDGEVVPFIEDMPAAFAEADLVICRSGAGACAELAAAGKPAILVPFPFAADDHQLRNAEILAAAGAARLVRDAEFDGKRLFEEVRRLASERRLLERMGEAARRFARPGAAARAADLLEEVADRRF